MDIYFTEEKRHDEEFVKTLANKIGKSTVNDVLSDFSLNYADMKVEAVLDERKIEDKRLDLDEILAKIQKNFKKLILRIISRLLSNRQNVKLGNSVFSRQIP